MKTKYILKNPKGRWVLPVPYADKDHILPAVDKATPRQFQHQGFVDRWNGTKLETIQCFNDGEPGPGQSQFLSMLIPLNWDFPYQLAIGRFSTLLAIGYDGNPVLRRCQIGLIKI